MIRFVRGDNKIGPGKEQSSRNRQTNIFLWYGVHTVAKRACEVINSLYLTEKFDNTEL